MRVNREEGWIEVLFKVVGQGLQALGEAKEGDVASIIGPIGQGFVSNPDRPRALLIGGGVGIPPMVFLAEQMHEDTHDWQPMVLMGSELPFPFQVQHSAIETQWLDDKVVGAMPLMERMRICSRLSTLSGFEGCYDGYVTDLARQWLATLDDAALNEVEIYSCGPTPMLQAVARLAEEFNLPAQVSLEEFMACAVGGCAGCAVEVQTDDGPAMKRVCVDGPVFDSRAVFPT